MKLKWTYNGTKMDKNRPNEFQNAVSHKWNIEIILAKNEDNY